MLERILPPSAAVVATTGDLDDDLFPAEEAVVGAAVEKRRREFATGRACARRALSRLGVEPVAIGADPRGAPSWPPGVVGSITHCDGYRACAAARDEDLLAVGVDAEPDEPLPQGVLGDIALAGERRMLGELAAAEPGVCWDRLLFSAKETVYKAWYPLARRWLGFEDAALTIDRSRRTYSARLLVPGPEVGGRELTGFEGRWDAADGLVVTAIAVEAGSGEAAR